MARVKKGPIKILVFALFIGGIFALIIGGRNGWVPMPGILKAVVPQKAVLPDVKEAKVENVIPTALPSNKPASIPSVLVRGEIWEWNAQANLIYANGASQTTSGSLMEKHGVNLLLVRQDDTSKMQEDLIACAKELHDGANQCSTGANFVIIMGDGSGQFLAAINPQLAKLGPEYKAIVIGATGYSRGEDACMGPPEVKQNPQAMRGLLFEAVLRDGDWDTCLKLEGDNNVPNNPDEKTFDPDAVNWVNAPDYNTAAADYVAGKCEDRKEIKNGRLTGKIVHVCVSGVATWTPGDVTVAQKKGGLVKLVSSKQYRSQMPAVILGPRVFFQKNRPEIEGMLAATFEAGDQLKAFDKSLRKAADISAKVYNDQDEDYWYKYFKGVTETDAQGLKVELGGSAVNNLADNLILFGLQPGSNDNFRSTYTVFGNIVMQQYPHLFKDTPIPDVKEIEDKSFITGAQARMENSGATADEPVYVANRAGSTVSRKTEHINFQTGQASLTSDGEETVRRLKDSLAITGLLIKLDGYTDNSGPEDTINKPLSDARARAVKDRLKQLAPENFRENRFVSVRGHGSQNPIASNASADGKAANRRVDITLIEQQ
jgi:OOP family OmpA-OmpF porin